jgi:membrane protein implicated in regulation of membrane protease activity
MSFIFPTRLLQFFGLLPSPPPESNEPEGVIVDVIKSNEEWLIKFRATYWKARSRIPANFQPKDRVRVTGYRIVENRPSNTLMIEPLDD